MNWVTTGDLTAMRRALIATVRKIERDAALARRFDVGDFARYA